MNNQQRSKDMNEQDQPTPETEPLMRLPGLFRRWEIEQVLEPGTDYHIEEAGDASDGTKLFAVYRRAQDDKEA